MSEPEATSAYDLLSRPTLDLTDTEVELIVADLRKRRKAYVEAGKKDTPKLKAAPRTADEQKALKAELLASMNLDFDL